MENELVSNNNENHSAINFLFENIIKTKFIKFQECKKLKSTRQTFLKENIFFLRADDCIFVK